MNHLTVQQLSAALDGALNGPSLELVVHHLAHCHECRDRQARLARNDDVMRRLLSQDPHDFFLDDLERRVEAVVVAILQGLPVPPMVTSSPLQAEEDPFQPVEPPLPERPELGRAGALAQEAGFGRIGMKPTGATQPPTSDPAEAQKLLEALERGDTSDFTEFTTPGGRENAEIDGPVFDLPGWIKQAGPKRPPDPKPRELPKVQLFLEQLGDKSANLSHGAGEGLFDRDKPAPALPPGAAPVPPPTPSATPAEDPPRFTPPHVPAPRASERPSRPDSGPWPTPPKLPTADEIRFMPPAPATPAAPRADAPAGGPPRLPQPASSSNFMPPASTPEPEPAPARASVPPPAASPPRVEKPLVVVQETPWRKSSAAIPRPVLPPALAKVTERRPPAPDVVVKETPWRKSSAMIPRPVISPERLKAFQESAAPKPSAPVPEPPAREAPAPAAAADLPPRFVKPVTEAYEQVSGPPRRKVPRVRRTQRIAGAWVLATASVGGLLVLVLALQFLPPADTPGATAWRGFQWPQLQFAPGDSTHDVGSPEPGDVVRTATTRFPVDAPVPSLEDSLFTPFTDSTGTVQDSSAATPDSLGAASGH